MAELLQDVIAMRRGVMPTSALTYANPPGAEQLREVPVSRRSDSFLDDLYATAVDPARMACALTNLVKLFAADEAILFSFDPRSQVETGLIIGHSDRRECGRPEMTERELAALLAARARTDAAELWFANLERPPAKGGLRPAGHCADVNPCDCLVVVPNLDGPLQNGLVVLRSNTPFSDTERDRARALLPDIRRALELRLRVGRAEPLGLGAQLFDRNPVAILVTRLRSIEQGNAAALALLPDRRPIDLAGGKLRFEDSRANAAFEAISRSDLQSSAVQSFAFIVEGVDGSTWIAQLSQQRSGQDGSSTSAVVVALTPFNAASKTRETMLNGFPDLTPTERTIFAAFVDGHDIAAIATRLNRSVETVRWHVRNLFTKLGVNSQADLARLGALLLPI
jgi:DNA-binding CsgD family transcriptional regulator